MKVPPLNLRKMQGFTLIELLVVISIIAILATIGVAGGNIVIRKARELQAKQAMASVIIAIKGYKTEYLRMPSSETTIPSEDNEAFDTADETGKALLVVLLGDDLTHNPRGARLWEAPAARAGGAGYTTDKGLLDPWAKNGYYIILDYSGNGRITNPYAGSEKEQDELVADVIMYSAGANMKFEEGGSSTGHSDDVKSW